ncbi:MAG: hypothetical protein WD075_12585 [Rhodospirillales bacterium]
MKPDGSLRRLRSLGVFGAFLLSACAGTAPPPHETTTAPASSPAYKPAPVIAKRTPVPESVPEINAPQPDAVIGWQQEELSRTFGTASLIRRDLGAEIWQYRTDQCVLFLFLYPKAGSTTLQVDHLDVRGTDDAALCLKAVVRAYAERGTG